MTEPGTTQPRVSKADAAPVPEITLSEEDFNLIAVFDFRVMNSLEEPYLAATRLKDDPFNSDDKDILQQYSDFLFQRNRATENILPILEAHPNEHMRALVPVLQKGIVIFTQLVGTMRAVLMVENDDVAHLLENIHSLNRNMDEYKADLAGIAQSIERNPAFKAYRKIRRDSNSESGRTTMEMKAIKRKDFPDSTGE